jgi:hypothetical protein
MDFENMSCGDLVAFINDQSNNLADRQAAYAIWESRCNSPEQSGNNGPAPIRPH